MMALHSEPLTEAQADELEATFGIRYVRVSPVGPEDGNRRLRRQAQRSMKRRPKRGR